MKRAIAKPKEDKSYEVTSPLDRTGEIEDMSRVLAESYQQRIKYYESLKNKLPDVYDYLTPEEIQKQATSPYTLCESVQDTPVEMIEWPKLQSIVQSDPQKLIELWDYLVETANKDFRSGSFAADIVKCRTPFERAQFLTIRQSFIDQWQPAGGIDLTLIDIMAQAQMCYMRWLKISILVSEYNWLKIEANIKEDETWQRPSLSRTEMMEAADRMMDRYNRLLMRTLRQLRDLRRYESKVTINNAKQVNIAAEGGKQLNLQENRRKSRTQKRN